MPARANDTPTLPELDGENLIPWSMGLAVRSALLGDPTEDDLAAINKIAKIKLAASAVFRFRATASTNAIDSYFTHMDESSLVRFRKQLAAGSALLDSHNMYRLPIGSSFHGETLDIAGGKAEGVEATRETVGDYFLIRNMEVPGSGNTNSYIQGIEAGMFSRMSIGFGGPDMRIVCDVDGSDLWDWDSWHYPGERLEDGTIVTYSVFDADLYETSIVYKNATPGALVKRLQFLVTERRIKPNRVGELEARYGVRLVVPPGQYIVSAPAARNGAANMPKLTVENVGELAQLIQTRAGKKLSAATRDTLSGIADRAATAGTSVTDIADDLVALVADAEGESATDEDRAIVAEVRSAWPVAEQGKAAPPALNPTNAAALVRAGHAYRASLIDEAIKARVTVVGQQRFTAEREAAYRARLERMDVADLEAERDDWREQRGGLGLVPGRNAPIMDPVGAGVGGAGEGEIKVSVVKRAVS